MDMVETALKIQHHLQKWGTPMILVLLLIFASSQSDVFLTERNIMNVLRQIAGIGLLSIGMLFVILTRGIDLSVGSIAALGSVLSAMFVEHMAPGTSVVVTVLIGATCGLVSGVLIAHLKLPPFVTTLAMMTIVRGLALIFSEGQPIVMGEPGQLLTQFGSGYLFGVPLPVILMLTLFLIAGGILTYTRFGRLVTAIGSNSEAVRLSGIRVNRYVVSVYVISGGLAALAGIISTSRTGVGSATIGVAAELDAIAAVVIGGASLMGGRGTALNTLIGCLILGVIANLMNLAKVPGYHQQVFMGLIIVIAMLLQYGTHLRAKSSG
ncbi:Ribose transport system permease protein rbsC [Vibrio nigripulchritudo]|uniref:Ribose transport system permease protein rbsC n=2 Tax=Vibrio nigripulchritudo TaxID=28173 RepID=U4K840_9VIBR|nr:ABC transporter permease [Vibrio sp. SCSIO 43132]UAB72971.1 ABC transporter permease [Vibrio sp. SCSIO 43132]CCO61522.1 Ribose transport system permease protein rbsC [Vibrio nigripulchritudo]